MPEIHIEISVSRREADRPRLLQITALDAQGGLEGVSVRLRVDENGSFRDDDASPLREREVVTGSHGIAFFQWFEWPRNGPARDFTSTVTAAWQDDDAVLFMEDLHE